ncbi:MAG TPA: GIY-YIG nuclease family protein [Polyangia bacterium]|nr:GIY-YIG nuclease family protein [Polyangia bacterium]
MSWSVYLARCADESLYCGIAVDVGARIAAHDAGRGARYTRGRGPLTVIAVRRCREKGIALSIEHAIKQLPRADKMALAAAPNRLAAIARGVYRKRARQPKSALRRARLSAGQTFFAS